MIGQREGARRSLDIAWWRPSGLSVVHAYSATSRNNAEEAVMSA